MKCENLKISIHETPILDRGEEAFRSIRVRKGECMKYLLFPEIDGNYERKFIIEEGAIFHGSCISIGANMVLKMSVFIEGNDSEGYLQILGLAQNNAHLELSGIGRVAEGYKNVKLRVDQTNILLGTGARIRGIPVLEVATDSIEGGHSCRVHRISGEVLFYLESHGIDRTTAEGMLLEAEIHRCTDLLEERGEDVKGEVLKMLGLAREA